MVDPSGAIFGIISLPGNIEGAMGLYERFITMKDYDTDLYTQSGFLHLEMERLKGSVAMLNEQGIRNDSIDRIMNIITTNLKGALALAKKHNVNPDDVSTCLEPKQDGVKLGKRQQTTCKLTWAAADKSRFKELVDNVHRCNEDLFNFIPSQHKERSEMNVVSNLVAGKDISGLQTISQLREEPRYSLIGTSAALKSVSLALRDNHVTPNFAEASSYISESLLSKSYKKTGTECYVSARLERRSQPPVDVLIEWRERFATSMSPQESDTRLDKLVKMLQMLENNHFSNTYHRDVGFGVLHCLGWTTPKRGDINERVGLVFEYPLLSTTSPISLRKMILASKKGDSHSGDTSEVHHRPSLGARFRLAQRLSLIFGSLLLTECLHKGIRSDNIIFFEKDNIDSPFLSGFTEARASNTEGVSSMPNDENRRYERYRPFLSNSSPGAGTVHGSSTQQKNPWSAYADMYGLGIILLEIGLWTYIGEIQGNASFQDLHCKIIPKVAKSIIHRTGEIYYNAVKQCLEAGEKWRRREIPDDIWFEYSRGVIKRFADCNA
ncbi:hypothetical protein MferCBS31731_004294 [Microsporum ferrugineum]